jgi:hypothetical protein
MEDKDPPANAWRNIKSVAIVHNPADTIVTATAAASDNTAQAAIEIIGKPCIM